MSNLCCTNDLKGRTLHFYEGLEEPGNGSYREGMAIHLNQRKLT